MGKTDAKLMTNLFICKTLKFNSPKAFSASPTSLYPPFPSAPTERF